MATKAFLAIEWNCLLLEENYNMQVNEVIEHTSTKLDLDDLASLEAGLEDCLVKFHRTEVLENTIKCEGCNKQTIQ